MKLSGNSLQYSASDLVNFLGCKHLNALDRKCAMNEICEPDWVNPSLAHLQQMGLEHENAYVQFLNNKGLKVCKLDGNSVEDTVDSMKNGYDIITQAKFKKDGYAGIADILKKIEGSSVLGNYHYEVEDTKLAQETKAGTVLQLCLYSELLGNLQGKIPQSMAVVKPGENFPAEIYRYAEFESYYRYMKSQFQKTMDSEIEDIYPLPVSKCDTCRWWKECDKKWHLDDHLTLIAGIRSTQIKELTLQEINTLADYAKENKPYKKLPEHGSAETYDKIHEQAKIQLRGRIESNLLIELLSVEPLRGLNRLPVPSAGDIYFDIEGDHFYEEGGIEYLLGLFYKEEENLVYKRFWSKNRKEEKNSFAELMHFVMDRWSKFPDMHIFHYAPYEPSAIKRLASRNALFEEEVDKILRAELFVDLFSVIKETLRASVESYSLKDMELFTDYRREANLRLASEARRKMSIALDFNVFSSISVTEYDLIELYNQDDCRATHAIHLWLEDIYQSQKKEEVQLSRPEIKLGEASEAVEEKDAEAKALFEALVANLPSDIEKWGIEEEAKWLLAHQVEFYRRELKSAYWEFFRLNDLDGFDLIDERKGIFGLNFVGEHPDSKKTPVHSYTYPSQDVSLEIGKELIEPKGFKIGKIHDFSLDKRLIHIKKTNLSKDIHPISVFINEVVLPRELVPSLFKFVREVLNIGIDGKGKYRAGRDLLLKRTLRLVENSAVEVSKEKDPFETSLALLLNLDQGVLPIQGPPGTGKTHLGGELICELVRRGKKVGVTAISHKVIRNLLDKAKERSDTKGINLDIRHKGKSDDKDPINLNNNEEAVRALNQNSVVGGTAWLWANDDFEEMLDYIFIDEAGQMSLANVITISRAAKNIVLLGDPQQLEQPTKGAHPENADISALEYVLDGHKTMPSDKGIFLELKSKNHKIHFKTIL
jgi:uncharacterized protein